MLLRFRESYFYIFLWLFFAFHAFGGALVSVGIPGVVEFYNNKSTSMIPAIRKGDLSVVEIGSNYNYKVGDIIIFHAQINEVATVITHRIIAIGGNVYITQGDNNPNGQEIVIPRLIIGKVIFLIPYLGSYYAFLKSNVGTYLLIWAPALILISTEIAYIKSLYESETE